jgi:hypothetical protein
MQLGKTKGKVEIQMEGLKHVETPASPPMGR